MSEHNGSPREEPSHRRQHRKSRNGCHTWKPKKKKKSGSARQLQSLTLASIWFSPGPVRATSTQRGANHFRYGSWMRLVPHVAVPACRGRCPRRPAPLGVLRLSCLIYLALMTVKHEMRQAQKPLYPIYLDTAFPRIRVDWRLRFGTVHPFTAAAASPRTKRA